MMQNKVARECWLYANARIEWENFRKVFWRISKKKSTIDEIEVVAGV